MIKQFVRYYKPYLWILWAVILGTCFSSVLDLLFPVVVRDIIQTALPFSNMALLWIDVAALFVLYALNFLVQYGVQYYGHRMSASIEHDMRRDLFSHLETLSFRYFDNEKTGQLLSRITSDVTEVSELSFRGPNDLLVCVITMTGTLAIMLFMNAPLALLIGGLLLFKAFHTVSINQKMKQAFRKSRVKAGEVSARAEESLGGIRLVKAFAQEDRELERFSRTSEDLRDTRFCSYKLVAYFTGSINFFTNLTNLVVLLAGGLMIAGGWLSLSDFVAFLLYVNIFMKPVFRLTMFTEMYQRGMAGFARFEEILHIRPLIRDPAHPAALTAARGNICFDHLSFGYLPERPVLKDLNFSIRAGETVAFVGQTGTGKTTLVNLLLRFYDPTEGRILLDGRDIRQYRQQDLRRQIGIVQQDVFLFSDTVAGNIAYGRMGASEEEIEKAGTLAAADEFIRNLPEGYHTGIGERGVKLSGGQKQRLAIARVFLKDPPIVILDEATSSLDTQTEQKIQETLDHLAKSRTTIIIAHRLSTVRDADRIIVMDQGRICEEGTHEELIRAGGRYFQLYEAQRRPGDETV